jgi:HSP20 family protein
MRNWDLLREMSQMQRDIDTVFRGFGLGRLLGSGFEAELGLRDWPRINLREDADHIYVEALLPGVDPDKIDMNVLGNTLTLAGERNAVDSEKNGRTWHRRERGAGKFLRTIELPVEINPDQVKAEYKNGLLRVTLPKVEEAKPKRISIKVR